VTRSGRELRRFVEQATEILDDDVKHFLRRSIRTKVENISSVLNELFYEIPLEGEFEDDRE